MRSHLGHQIVTRRRPKHLRCDQMQVCCIPWRTGHSLGVIGPSLENALQPSPVSQDSPEEGPSLDSVQPRHCD